MKHRDLQSNTLMKLCNYTTLKRKIALKKKIANLFCGENGIHSNIYWTNGHYFGQIFSQLIASEPISV